jgi:GNAT superfamily N-acetyltransferase
VSFIDASTIVRRARPDEAAHLTALALRSKAYWGYDADFMAACVPSLTISSERIATPDEHVLVAEDAEGTVVGFAALRPDHPDSRAAELTDLFVEPAAIGRGYGWRLWQQTIELARSLGVQQLRIEADPFAEPFYLRQGAERIGEVPSVAIPGRALPLLRFTLA